MSNLSPKDAVLNLKLQLWFEEVDGWVDGPNADRLKHRVRRVEGLQKQILFENEFKLKTKKLKKPIFYFFKYLFFLNILFLPKFVVYAQM
jgi:hypothetical protein